MTHQLGGQYSLLFPPAIQFGSEPLGLFELTWRPSRALNLALYLASELER